MAILGVLIYGATHQQASSNISVKYTVPTYTVTFDPNGGELSTIGGGVSSKQVTLGDTYGDLPVPTRTGYSFVGWRGRNYLNGYKFTKSGFVENFSYKNDILTITSVTKTTPEEVSGTEQAYVGAYLSLSKGRYMVSFENRTYTETIDYPEIALIDRSVEPQGYIWGSHFSSDAFFTLNRDYSTLFFVVYANINSNGWTSGTITYNGLMIYKVSSENEVVKYEPYYIESDTQFSNSDDRVLTAEWGIAVGDLSNYSAWVASSDVKSYSCNGNDLTITSKEKISYQAYILYGITFPVGTYLFAYDNFDCSGDKSYPQAAVYYYTSSSSFETAGYLQHGVQRHYFTFNSSCTGSIVVYACIDTSSSVSCTVSFKNLRLIKLP